MLKKRGKKRKIKCCARISYCCYFPNILHHNPKGAGKDFCPTSPVLMSFLKPYYLLITLTLLKRKKHSLHFQGFFAFLILFFFFPKTGCILAISSLPWLLQSYKHLCLCSHIMVKTKAVYNAILTRQIYHSLPPSHLPRGKKKKKNLTSTPSHSGPHLIQLNLMTCQLISISLLWKLLKFSTSEAHKLIAQQSPQQRKYWPSTHTPTQKTSKSLPNIFAMFHIIILTSFDLVNPKFHMLFATSSS